MKTRSKLTLLFVLVLLLSTLSGPRVSGQGGDMVYLPLVGRRDPPQRLGPNVSPASVGFAVDPADPAVVYAGTNGGGVYKTVNGGAEWVPASQGLPASALVYSMAIDPLNPLRVYAGLAYNYEPNFASGVYRSEDGGTTWMATARMDNPDAGIYSNRAVVYALAISPDGSILYAGTRMKVEHPPYPSNSFGYGGVFKSTDHGVSWTLVNNGLPYYDLYVYDLSIDPADPARVYAALHGSAVFRTDNGGGEWFWKNSGIPSDVEHATEVRAIVVNAANTNRVLFGSSAHTAYQSNNRASSWHSNVLNNIFKFSLARSQWHAVYASRTSGDIYFSDSFGDYWTMRSRGLTNGYFTADPTNVNTLYAGGVNGPAGTKKSVDMGATFTPVTHGISGYPVTGLVLDQNNADRMFVSLFGWGVMGTNDGGASWNQVINGLPNLYIQGLAVDPNNLLNMLALTQDNGIYRLNNAGDNWYSLSPGYPMTSGIALNALDLAYREPPPLESPLGPGDETSSPGLNASAPAPALSAAISPTQSNLFVVGTAGKGVVQWNGAAWAPTNVVSGSVYALLFDRAANGTVWMGADPTAGTLQVSLNGQGWASSAAGLSGRTVFALAQGILDPNQLLAGTDAGIYLSTNHGASWTPAGLSSQAVKAVAFHPDVTGRIVAGTAESVFVSDNSGASWHKSNPSLDGYDFLGVATTEAARGFFYFASRYGGVVRVNE